jgi:hypothetical protein
MKQHAITWTDHTGQQHLIEMNDLLDLPEFRMDIRRVSPAGRRHFLATNLTEASARELRDALNDLLGEGS